MRRSDMTDEQLLTHKRAINNKAVRNYQRKNPSKVRQINRDSYRHKHPKIVLTEDQKELKKLKAVAAKKKSRDYQKEYRDKNSKKIKEQQKEWNMANRSPQGTKNKPSAAAIAEQMDAMRGKPILNPSQMGQLPPEKFANEADRYLKRMQDQLLPIRTEEPWSE